MAEVREVPSSELESDEDVVALYGPKPLPGTGRGGIKGQQRKLIEAETGCKVATRKRDGWECRMLTIAGPAEKLQRAKQMATAFILESQQGISQEDEVETPGADDDPVNTVKTAPTTSSKAARRKRKRANQKARENAQDMEDANAMQQNRSLARPPMFPPPGLAQMHGLPMQMGCPQYPMFMGTGEHPMMPMMPVPLGYRMVKIEKEIQIEKKIKPERDIKTEVKGENLKKDKLLYIEPRPKQVAVKTEKLQIPQHLRKDPKFAPCGHDDALLEGREEVDVVSIVDSDEEDDAADDAPLAGVPKARLTANPAASSHSSRLALSIQTINVYSVGWHHHGCKWQRTIDDLMPELIDRLHVRYRSLEDIHIFMDCRKFYQRPPGTGHVGTNEKDIYQFVTNQHFEPWLRAVKEHVESHEADREPFGADGRTLGIICACRAGRNRSVAAKTVLNYILSSSGYKTNSDSGHLSKCGWGSTRWPLCSTCGGCTTDTEWKHKSLANAFRIWNDI